MLWGRRSPLGAFLTQLRVNPCLLPAGALDFAPGCLASPPPRLLSSSAHIPSCTRPFGPCCRGTREESNMRREGTRACCRIGVAFPRLTVCVLVILSLPSGLGRASSSMIFFCLGVESGDFLPGSPSASLDALEVAKSAYDSEGVKGSPSKDVLSQRVLKVAGAEIDSCVVLSGATFLGFPTQKRLSLAAASVRAAECPCISEELVRLLGLRPHVQEVPHVGFGRFVFPWSVGGPGHPRQRSPTPLPEDCWRASAPCRPRPGHPD